MLIRWLAGHWDLWDSEYRIDHGDISSGKPTCNSVAKQRTPNVSDLARSSGWDRERAAKSNTGPLPFLALELVLSKSSPNATVQLLYRHEAEAFAWCLIYICLSVRKDDSQIRTIYRHPLSSWFVNIDACYSSKVKLSAKSFDGVPYHQRTVPMAVRLNHYWNTRHDKQRAAGRPRRSSAVSDTLPEEFRVRTEKIALKKKIRETLRRTLEPRILSASFPRTPSCDQCGSGVQETDPSRGGDARS